MINRGSNGHNWKGGKTIDGYGYVLIYKPDHPNARGGRYVPEHRLIMERHIGRRLKSTELVHHINGIKTDNRIKNLHKTTRKVHPKFHPKPRIDMSKRKCKECGSKNTSDFGNKWKMWYKIKNGFLCYRCWQKTYHKNRVKRFAVPSTTSSY